MPLVVRIVVLTMTSNSDDAPAVQTIYYHNSIVVELSFYTKNSFDLVIAMSVPSFHILLY